jgi:hypothetical protein
MLKAICKNLVWMAVPLSLALGCATHHEQTQASYGPIETLTPTSGEPEQRIYSSADPSASGTSTSVNTPPGGATAENWGLAEQIQQKLLSDTSLAPMGSKLIAEVGKDGTVTLKGNVSSKSEQQRVADTISNLPGVKGVNNELVVGRTPNNGRLNMQETP